MNFVILELVDQLSQVVGNSGVACPVVHKDFVFMMRHSIRFPLWKFLKQPVFEPSYKTVLNPYRFWRSYKLELLERCLAMDCASKDGRRN